MKTHKIEASKTAIVLIETQHDFRWPPCLSTLGETDDSGSLPENLLSGTGIR